MLNLHNLSFIVFFFGIFSSVNVIDLSVNSEWKLVTETTDWKVYTRSSMTSSVNEVKVVGVMHASFEAVKEAMSDVKSYPEWVYSCIDSYKFDAVDDANFYSYTKTDLPFPLMHRDLVVLSSVETLPDGAWQTVSNAQPAYIPEVDSAVRIENYHAEWKMSKNSDKAINFEYQLAMHPGGVLPGWIVNLAIAKIPVNTISALEERSISIMKKSVQSEK